MSRVKTDWARMLRIHVGWIRRMLRVMADWHCHTLPAKDGRAQAHLIGQGQLGPAYGPGLSGLGPAHVMGQGRARLILKASASWAHHMLRVTAGSAGHMLQVEASWAPHISRVMTDWACFMLRGKARWVRHMIRARPGRGKCYKSRPVKSLGLTYGSGQGRPDPEHLTSQGRLGLAQHGLTQARYRSQTVGCGTSKGSREFRPSTCYGSRGL